MVKTSPSSAGGAGSTPGGGAEIPHASWSKNQNIKQKQYCNKFNKDLKKKKVHIKKNLKNKEVVQYWKTMMPLKKIGEEDDQSQMPQRC